jgi:tetratricopeptide (TPR) repeat protein
MKTTIAGIGTAILFLAGLTSVTAQEVFDPFQVQLDFFAGVAGDAARMQKAMDTTERELARNPNNGSALVWHGMGLTVRSTADFQSGNIPAAMQTFQKGISEMERAVELEPKNAGVRIPRGAALREITRSLPPEMGAPLLEAARTDFQTVFEMQKDKLDQVGKPHPLGELLQGLGDIYSRQGKTEDAAKYYDMTLQWLPGTEYATRASEWMKTKQTLAEARSQCTGCHTPTKR